MRTSPQPQASQPQGFTTQQPEKVATKLFMLIPEDDVRWAMGQKPAVIKFFFECWLSERYGSRWMPLNTGLKDKTLKQAKAALRKAGLFEFRSEIKILEGGRYYETFVINLHGSRQSYRKSGGVADAPSSTGAVTHDPTEGTGEPQLGYTETPGGVVASPSSSAESRLYQAFQGVSISNSISDSLSPSISPHGETREEENKIFEKKVEADQDQVEVDQGAGQPKVASTDISLASLSEKPESAAQPKDPDQDQVFRPCVVRKTQKLKSNDVIPETCELLNNPVFVQWWVNRIEKSDFAKKLVKPPLAYVKGEIRSKPQVALDMWESFQQEMTSRVENINWRQQNGLPITTQEYEEIGAITPYSAITLQAAPQKLVATNELLEEEKQRLRQEATGGLSNRFKSFKPTTANNSTSNKLITSEQFQKRKDELLRQLMDSNETLVVPSPETTTNQIADYDEADFLGKPDPADFEAFWTSKE